MLATTRAIEDQIIEIIQRVYPDADFQSRSGASLLLTLLMNEARSPGIVPEQVIRAARLALDTRRKVGAGLPRTWLKEAVLNERVRPGWKRRFPELAKLTDEDFIADCEQRLNIPAETVRNYLYGKRGARRVETRRRPKRTRK